MEPAPPTRSRQHVWVLVSCLLGPLALFVLGLALEPDPRGFGTHQQLGFRPCFPMAHWNVPCPGCGVTTAVALAAHGAPLASLRTQPLGLGVLLVAVAAALWAVHGHARGRDLGHELTRLAWRPLWLSAGTVALFCWLYKLARVRGWFA